MDPFAENDATYEDELIESDDKHAIAKQFDKVVSWEIEGLYKDNDNLVNKFVLGRKPPILRVSSSTGEEVTLVLSKELAKTLNKALEASYKAYYGIDIRDTHSMSNIGLASRSKRFLKWVERHSVAIIGTMAVIATIIVIGVLF